MILVWMEKEMADEQWTDEKWREFEIEIDATDDLHAMHILLETTRTQDEHPEWYESPCLCCTCCSYGD